MVAAATGVGLGIPTALATSRLMSSLLFGVDSADPRVYVAAAAGLSGVALLASWIPARRATRVDPVRAMRVE
jgi:putative ABC transport system permease protein